MTSTTSATPTGASNDLESFSEYLKSSRRILALCGAGLSASSGLPTFRGAGGYWRKYEATSLATPEAFDENPSLVWQFYSYRRHMALKVQPNKAHLALVELAKKKPDFLTISQNVDGKDQHTRKHQLYRLHKACANSYISIGLSQRAGHPPAQLELLHGSLSTVKCTNFKCAYVETNNTTDPIVPGLAIPMEKEQELDISSAEVPLKDINTSDLPHCPKCKTSLLRPGVVWFGEALPSDCLERVDAWVHDSKGIDLIIVIGTSASVYPAAGYIKTARQKGARVAVVNMERPDQEASRLQKGDWFFQGDAGVVVPRIFEAVTGPIRELNKKL